jgi:predicted SAM-dependent methyltransferase
MKLHLGCGKRFIPGFIHIDVVGYDHIDYLANIDDLSMFSDQSVQLIYNCHVLEHFHRRKVPRVLQEWFRVLAPGGVLRCAVPDFEALSLLYQKTKDLSLLVGPVFGRQDYLYNIHYSMYDFTTLEKLLIEAGFSTVRKYDWRKTEHSGVDDYSQSYYPHMDKEGGMLLSLNVEAVK